MSSSAPGSSPSKHQHRKPGGPRHKDDWLSKLHRRHDAKHHSDREQQAPLLADDHQDEQSETEALTAPPPRQSPWDKIRDVLSKTAHITRKTGSALGNGAKKVANAAGRGTSKAKQGVKKHHKKIMGAAIVLLTASTATVGGVHLNHLRHDKNVSYCTTPACIEAANNILQNLDPSLHISGSDIHTFELSDQAVDPCKQFDQFVCGGFERRYDLRADQTEMSTGSLIAEEVETILRHVVEQPPSKVSSKDKVIFEKLRDDYNACMADDKIKEAGLDPLKDVVKDIKRLFPTTDPVMPGPRPPQHIASSRVKATADSMAQTLSYLMKAGVKALVSFDVGADDKAPDWQAVFASPIHAIGLPSPEHYKDESLMAEYRQVIKSTLKVFYDVNINTTAVLHRSSGMKASVIDLAQGVADFEVKLSAVVPPREELMDAEKSYNKMSLSRFSALLPQMSVKVLTKELVPDGSEPKYLIVSSPEYLRKLSFTLQMTPKEIQQAFLVWKTIQSYIDKIEHPALRPLKNFNSRLKGTQNNVHVQRWRRCIQEANHDLGWVASRFYIANRFSPSSKARAEKIVDSIKSGFASILQSKDWMVVEDRKVAVEKALAIDQKIGYPTSNPDILDASAVQKYYANLAIDKESYFSNKINVARFGLLKEWSRLTEPTDRSEWDMYATTVNAYYNPSGNEITFPAAILRAPVLYDDFVPAYLSYGSFGAIAGHEISHAFDSTGSHYDKNGNLTEWWEDKTRQEFEKKTKCFVDQYAKFAVEGPSGAQNVNSKLTLGENIADAGGAHVAFEAWKKSEANSPSAVIPGLERFSKDQVFWLSFGNWWCSKTTPERAVQRLFSDTHAPKSVRILGTVANSRAFRDAFKCPVKEPTCELW